MTFHDHRTAHPAPVPPAADAQPGPVTLALRAMREAVAPPVGPVTDAIRTMRAADPAFDLNPDLRALRRALADRIEADLAALDALGGDPEAEPSLGSVGGEHSAISQEGWARGGTDDREHDAGDDREEENEHGGDIQDEPHDPEEDASEGEDEPDFRRYGGRHNPAIDMRGRELACDVRLGLERIRRRRAGGPPKGALRPVALPAGWSR